MGTENETQTTSPKPLLIRGDRLLLALDLLKWGLDQDRATCDRGEPPENSRGFKTSFSNRPFLPHGGQTSAVIHALHRFVSANNQLFTALEFDVGSFVEQELWWGYTCDGGSADLRPANPYREPGPLLDFFRRIASGELTEADFKE